MLAQLSGHFTDIPTSSPKASQWVLPLDTA